MAMHKNIFLIVIFVLLMFVNFRISAHSSQLDVSYDECNHDAEYMDEFKWYYNSRIVNNVETSVHINNKSTLYYYFFDYSPNDTITWSTGTSNQVGEEIKEAFAASMEYWNNVYFYTYDSNGNRIPNKIINIEEGSLNNYDIAIYPVSDIPYINDYAAATSPIIDNDTTIVEQTSSYSHLHCNKWYINVNVHRFHTGTYGVTEHVMVCNRLRAGAHEIGHILGLCDIDNQCNCGVGSHQLLLMGYVNVDDLSGNFTYEPIVHNRYVARPTYYDISGVAINREFHSDNDHIWIYDETHSCDRVFCAICNGYIDDVTLTNGMYEGQTPYNYLSCEHGIGSSHKYRLVATNGETDYYKCMYCHRVINLNVKEQYNLDSSFTSVSDTEMLDDRYFYNSLYPDGFNYCYKLNVTSSSEYIYIHNNGTSGESLSFQILDDELNQVSLQSVVYNSKNGYRFYLNSGTYYLKLSYSHSIDPDSQTIYLTKVVHTHNYNHHYLWLSYTNHRAFCPCGHYSNQPHIIDLNSYHNGYYTCLVCGGDASRGFVPYSLGINYITENGSCILSNGVIVLNEKDYYLIENNYHMFGDDEFNLKNLNNLYLKKKEDYYD